MKPKNFGLGKGIALLLAGIASKASGDPNGALECRNNLNGGTSNKYVAKHYDHPSVSEGVDQRDEPYLAPPGEFIAMYSLIESNPYVVDTRPITSRTPYFIHLAYNGTLTEDKPNWLKLEMPWDGWTFGTLPLTLQRADGRRNDVREVINNHDGELPLGMRAAGGYNWQQAYEILKLSFKDGADFNDDGIVNMLDYGILSKNWLNDINEGGVGEYLLGDFTGPSGVGIADGKVDMWDLHEFLNRWLACSDGSGD